MVGVSLDWSLISCRRCDTLGISTTFLTCLGLGWPRRLDAWGLQIPRRDKNFPASLGGLGDENWRIPLGFPITAVDILIQGPLQPSPNHPRTARGLFRQKRTVLIPHVRRELEHLDEDRRCSPVRPHARLPGLHKCSAGHIRDTVDSCSYKTGPGGWH